LGFDLDVVDDLETFQHMEPGLIERLSNEPKQGPPILEDEAGK